MYLRGSDIGYLRGEFARGVREGIEKRAGARHVLVTGHSGAGKSTLARSFNMPIYALDDDPAIREQLDAQMSYAKAHGGRLPTSRRFAERMRLAEEEAIGRALALEEPHVIEGSYLLNRDPGDFRGHALHLVDTPEEVVLNQRVSRQEAKDKARGRHWDDERAAGVRMRGQQLIDEYAPGVSRWRHAKGVRRHERAEHVARGGVEKRAGAYREGGTFTHEGVEYDLDSALRASERSPVRRVPLSKLEWVLAYDTPDPSRVSAADVRAPLLVTYTRDGRLTVVDGLHRLTKLKRSGARYAPTRYVPRGELEKVAMGFGWLGRGARAARAPAAAAPVATAAPVAGPRITIPPHLGGPAPQAATGVAGKVKNAWESARYHTTGMFGRDGVMRQAKGAVTEYTTNPVSRANVNMVAKNTMNNAAYGVQNVMNSPAGQFVDDAVQGAAGIFF